MQSTQPSDNRDERLRSPEDESEEGRPHEGIRFHIEEAGPHILEVLGPGEFSGLDADERGGFVEFRQRYFRLTPQ